jgi:hypothetical protein
VLHASGLVCTVSVKCREAHSKLVVEVLSLVSIATVDTGWSIAIREWICLFLRSSGRRRYVCWDEVSSNQHRCPPRYQTTMRSEQKQSQEWRQAMFQPTAHFGLLALLPFLYNSHQETFQSFFSSSWRCNEQITQRCSMWQTKGLRFYKVCILWICDSACASLAELSAVCSMTKLSILWSDCEEVKSVIF